MSSAFRGKLIENVLVQQLDTPLSRTVSTTLYNGIAATSVSYIDGKGFDEVVIILTKGVVASGAAVAATIVESADTDPSAATAVTSATFTPIAVGNTGEMEVISLQSKNLKRYLWLKTVKSDVTGYAAAWAAVAIKKTKESASTSVANVIADLPA